MKLIISMSNDTDPYDYICHVANQQEGVEAEGHLDGGGSNPLSFMVSDSLEYPEFIRETSVVN